MGDCGDISLFGDHTRAYYYWQKAIADGNMQKGAVLIHVDAHDDMKVRTDSPPPPDTSSNEQEWLNTVDNYVASKQIGVETFIAPAVIDGTVSEIYWVLPDWAKKDTPFYGAYWYPWKTGFDPILHSNSYLLGNMERDYTFYAWEEGGKAYFMPVPPQNDFVVARKIIVHKVYKEDLPDFTFEKRSIILDIDQDWMNNIRRGLSPNNSLAESIDLTLGLTDTLAEKNVRPSTVTVASSPSFANAEQVEEINDTLIKELPLRGVLTCTTITEERK